MKLSVIVPTHKTPENLLRRCLASVDRMANTLSQADAEVELIRIDGMALAEARNEGLRRAVGDWVWFVDADDEVKAPTTELTEALTGSHAADIVLFGVNTRWGRFGKSWETTPEAFCGELPTELLRQWNENLLFRFAWNKFYRRSFLVAQDVRFEHGTEPCEDAIFNLKCVLAHARWIGVPQIGYIYWKRLGSSLFRHSPTIESACRRENELWRKLGCSNCGWSEERLAARIWENRWLPGGEPDPPLKWRVHRWAQFARRALRFVNV